MSTNSRTETVTVTKLDKTTEIVTVRELGIREMPKFGEAVNDEGKMIAVACDKPVEFADTLTPESHIALIGAVDELNIDFFGRWLARRKVRMELLAPGIRPHAASESSK